MNNRHKLSTEWAIFAGFLLLYLVFPNNNQGYDSYSYAISVKHGTDLFHPHHLLYNLFGYVIYRIFAFTDLGSMKILSLANSILAAFTLVFIYKIIRHKAGEFMAALGSILIGSLFTFWYCATSVEVNMIAMFFLILALYFLIVKENSPSSPWLVYLFLCIGMLFHQHIAIAGIPIFIYYVYKFRSLGKALRPAHPGILGGALIYLVVAIQHASQKNIKGIYEWMTEYTRVGAWGKFQLSAFRDSVWGVLKLFFGGEQIRQMFYGGGHDYSTIIYIIFILIIFAGIGYLSIRAVYNFFKHRDPITIVLAALAIVYALFTFWWAPTIDDFWLYPAVMFLIFMFITIIQKRYIRILIVSLTTLLLCINIACEFVPFSNKANSYIDQGVVAFERLQLTGDDLVITNYSQVRLAYEYYTDIFVPTACIMYLPLGDKDSVLAEYHARIDSVAQVGQVFTFEDELHPEPDRAYLFERFGVADYDSVYARYFDRLVPIDSIMVHGRNVHIYKLTQ